MQRQRGGNFRRLADGNGLPIMELLCCSCCQPSREYEIVEPSPRYYAVSCSRGNASSAGQNMPKSCKGKGQKAGGSSHDAERQQLQRTLSWADTRGSSTISLEAPTDGARPDRRRGRQASRNGNSASDSPDHTPPSASPSVTPAERTPRVRAISAGGSCAFPSMHQQSSMRQSSRLCLPETPKERDRSNVLPSDVYGSSREVSTRSKASQGDSTCVRGAENRWMSKAATGRYDSELPNARRDATKTGSSGRYRRSVSPIDDALVRRSSNDPIKRDISSSRDRDKFSARAPSSRASHAERSPSERQQKSIATTERKKAASFQSAPSTLQQEALSKEEMPKATKVQIDISGIK